jgi:hypothetical protein
MCMFEHVFSKFQNIGLVYITSTIYGFEIRCKLLDLNATSPNDAQNLKPYSEINLV